MSDRLGERVRRLRLERGLTQAQLAGDRLSESYVSLIESGRRSPTSEVIAYLAEALGCNIESLSETDSVPDASAAELLIRRGEWEMNSGRAAAAREHLMRGIEVARDLRLEPLIVRGRVATARALEADGDLRGAIAAWEELWVDAQADPRHVPTAPVAVGLSRCYRELGDLERAIQVGEQYWGDISHHDLADPAVGEDAVVVGATLLSAYLELGDQARCRQLAGELIHLAESVDTPMATGAAYWNAALAAEADGRIAEALHLAEQAQGRMALTQDIRNRARLQVVLGGLNLRVQPPDPAEAARLLAAAEPVLAQFGSPLDVAYCRTELSRAYFQAGDTARARRLAQTTIADLERIGEAPIEMARTLMVLAIAEAAARSTDAAKQHARQAAELLQQVGANMQSASCWTELAELCVDLGDSQGAIAAFRRATELLGAKKTVGSADTGTDSAFHTEAAS